MKGWAYLNTFWMLDMIGIKELFENEPEVKHFKGYITRGVIR